MLSESSRAYLGDFSNFSISIAFRLISACRCYRCGFGVLYFCKLLFRSALGELVEVASEPSRVCFCATACLTISCRDTMFGNSCYFFGLLLMFTKRKPNSDWHICRLRSFILTLAYCGKLLGRKGVTSTRGYNSLILVLDCCGEFLGRRGLNSTPGYNLGSQF